MHIFIVISVILCQCGMTAEAVFNSRLKNLLEKVTGEAMRGLTDNNTCPPTFDKTIVPPRTTRLGHIAMFSVTGRVGSSNLLGMLNSGSISSVGEIFSYKNFKSRGLDPNIHSAEQYPASSDHKMSMIVHIRRVFKASRSSARTVPHLLASIKFWHAWVNGVTIEWLGRQLFIHGCVSHFILISRNPVRITISEQYAHQHHQWRHSAKDRLSKICSQARMAFHIGGRWASEMAVTQYYRLALPRQFATLRSKRTPFT